MIEKKLKELNYSLLESKNNEILCIKLDSENFYLKVNIKKGNDKLIIFSNGAVNRDIKSPPIFMRSTWAEDIEANCIFLDDKTIHNNKIPIGWG